MSRPWTPTRKYLLIFFLFACGAPLIGLLNFLFFKKSYEFEHVDTLVRLQLQAKALYYPALHEVTYPYKLALFQRLKPKIVAMGSSRVQQFRGHYFTAPFVNLGAP